MNISKILQVALIVSSALFLAGMGATDISDYDIWWHLKLGEIVYQTAAPYQVDTFSYTFAGQKQFNGEWLGDLLWYLAYLGGGIPGITVFKIILLLATAWFLALAVREATGDDEGLGLQAAIITLVVVAFAVRFRLFPRPYLFSFLFFSIFLYVLHRYGKTKSGRILYALPIAALLWANMSKGAFFGALLVLFFLVSELARKKADKNLFLTLGLVIGASLINPASYAVYTLPFAFSTGHHLADAVGEHQPLTTALLWGVGMHYTLGFQVLVAGALIYFVFFGGWKNIFQVLLFIAFFVQAIKLVRMIDFFALANAVAFSVTVHRVLLFARRYNMKPVLSGAALVIALVALLPAAIVQNRTYAFGFGIKEKNFPESALAILDREGIKGSLFNSYAYGGYIIWRAPHRKVYIDGRVLDIDGAGSEGILRKPIGTLYSGGFYEKYQAMLRDRDAWEQEDAHRRFDYAVLDYDLMSRRYPLHLATAGNWATVYWDDHSVVAVKRTEANRAVIERRGYRIARPTLYDFAYLDSIVRSKQPREKILRDLDWDIALNPKNQEPILAKAYYLFSQGASFYPDALTELERAGAVPPDMAIEHSARAFLLLQLGRKAEAHQEVSRALALDPYDQQAVQIRKSLNRR